MASYSHGYYGLSGSSKTADFGLAANMTLPILTPLPDLDTEVAAEPSSATMPNERKKSKKKARFSADTLDRKEKQELAKQQQSNGYGEEVVLRNLPKKSSWRSRLSGVFKRNTKRGGAYEAEGAQVQQEEALTAAVADSDLPTRTVDDSEVDLKKSEARRKKRKKRSAKSRSTAFDESPFPQGKESSSPNLLKLALRPKNASSDFKDIRVTLRCNADGFGIHLSGGLPPISVTYVQPGSEAESARIVVGDIVTEVNGHDCRKGVGISRIMELKTLIQQTSVEQEETTDGVWEKIKEKQVELESDDSEDGEITRIDDTSESEEEPPKKTGPPPKIETPKQNVTKEKPQMKRQTKIEQSEMETPSKRKSPRKEFSENDKSKQKSPQKSPQVDHSKAAKINPKSSTPKKGTKKKKQSDPVAEQQQVSPPVITPLSSPIKPSGNDNSLVTVGVIKKPKQRKIDDESRQDHEKSRQSVNGSSFLDVINSSTLEGAKKQKKKKKRTESEAPRAGMHSMMTPRDLSPEPSILEPKSRDSDTKKSKGKSKKKPKSVDTPQGKPPESKKRLKHSASDSKTKSAVEDSDDLEYVDYGNPSPSRNYNRRKSVDMADQDIGLLQISSQKRSTSYHALDKEERRMFREELKEASKSEYNIKDKSNGGPKIDIDPDVKVKKSGKVLVKRTKRPTILDTDGAEPEAEVKKETLTKKKVKRQKRNSQVLDMDISSIPKTNPSLGLKHGHEKLDVVSRSASKRRPASKRKTLLLDSKKEVLMGNERVDLSDPGDGKLLRQASVDYQVNPQAVEKPLSEEQNKPSPPEPERPETPEPKLKTPEPKLKTPEPEKPKKQEPKKPQQPVAAADINQPMARPRRQSIIEYMESLQKAKYNSLSRPNPALDTHTEEEVTPLTQSQSPPPTQSQSSPTQNTAPKRIVPTQEEAQKIDLLSLARLANNAQKAKTETQPAKKLTSESTKDTLPAWVSIAQNKRERGSMVVNGNTNKTNTEPAAKTSSPPTVTVDPLLANKRSDDSVPKMGTVMDRLAMFQRK